MKRIQEVIAVDATGVYSSELTLDHRHSLLCLNVNNTGAVALADFKIQVKVTDSSAWVDYVTNFSTPGSFVKFVSANLETLGATTKADVVIELNAVLAVRLFLQGDSGNTSVTTTMIASDKVAA